MGPAGTLPSRYGSTDTFPRTDRRSARPIDGLVTVPADPGPAATGTRYRTHSSNRGADPAGEPGPAAGTSCPSGAGQLPAQRQYADGQAHRAAQDARPGPDQ